MARVLEGSSQVFSCLVSVDTGNRRIRLEMARPVPNLLRVGDRVVQCEYEGVVRLCRRCNLGGHHAVACETLKCARCEQFGHEACDAAPTAATEDGDSQVSLNERDTAGGVGDSAASEALTSLSAAATCGEGVERRLRLSLLHAPAAAAVPAAVAALSGEPEPLASETTDAPFIEVVHIGNGLFVFASKWTWVSQAMSDSRFAREIVRCLWQPHELINRSVSGKVCMRKLKEGGEAKPALTPQKLGAVQKAYEHFVSKNCKRCGHRRQEAEGSQQAPGDHASRC
ncbi:hypothetical protein HPB49_003158 [Dermacentor silvarum]|uniref:Uncharacterized protein n=1 Tax=Dermacentor silvarum TaxID=543639 RepID=A0ACB8DTJ9_DERSI|nr:hypothetical protein HPB49_003158 [Dermacentor silvarum]